MAPLITYALFLVGVQQEHVRVGKPLVELALPVVKCGLWNNDQVRASDTLDVLQVSQE